MGLEHEATIVHDVDLLARAKQARRAARRALAAFDHEHTPSTERGLVEAVTAAERACSDLVTQEPQRWGAYMDWAFAEDN